MDTTSGAPQVTGLEVEAYHSPRRDDARRALRWYSRKTVPGCLRLLLWLVLPVAPAALGIARGVEPALWGALAMLGLFVAVYGAYLSFDRRAFRLYQLAARHREYRCTFSDSGVVTRLPDGTSSEMPWSACAGFGETRHLFLLLTKENGALLWLPKRAALTDTELDRIRELHERNLRRL
ncbi:YcxB family protein [Streptomyces virginiae]|uniref:YcxB family protein n=1 Tax=Streptomyces virginiae TaxID=1961 RepID=UPI0036C18301